MDDFAANATKLEQLMERVNETSRHRDKGPKELADWQQATKAFHSAYDELAFPGGLVREFELLNVGVPEAIEMAIRFLEADPRYFRSGYHKEDILKLLRKVPLSIHQTERLQVMILKHIKGHPTRETRAYCRLAPKASCPEFEADLKRLAAEGPRGAVQYAKLALQCIKSANPH